MTDKESKAVTLPGGVQGYIVHLGKDFVPPPDEKRGPKVKGYYDAVTEKGVGLVLAPDSSIKNATQAARHLLKEIDGPADEKSKITTAARAIRKRIKELNSASQSDANNSTND